MNTAHCLELSRQLKSNESEFEEFKFLLRKRIPDGKREGLGTPLQIFECLEQLELVGPDNLSELEKLLGLINCELCAKVSGFMEKSKTNMWSKE